MLKEYFSKIVESEILQSALNDPKQIQGIGHQKHPIYVHCSTLSPKFSPVSLYDQPFFETFHILGFPLTPMLKFQSATIF